MTLCSRAKDCAHGIKSLKKHQRKKLNLVKILVSSSISSSKTEIEVEDDMKEASSQITSKIESQKACMEVNISHDKENQTNT